MTAPTTPYTFDLGDRDPLVAIPETSERVRALTSGWPRERFERSYAPGKWSARQILTHLAQTELALGTRARMALTTAAYVAQVFDQDTWIGRDSRICGPEAVDAFVALARMNSLLFEGFAVRSRDAVHTPRRRIADGGLDHHQMAGIRSII
jgi:hypothetical protein